MQRRSLTPRHDWQATVESQGFHFHTLDDVPYWDESACYVLSGREVDELEAATYAVNDMCLRAARHVFGEHLLARFGIPPLYHDWLHTSWETDERTIYGRFDFALPQGGPPRLLEFNADTPT